MIIRRRALRTATYLVGAAILLIYLVPMALVLLNSLKSANEASTLDFSPPKNWLISNYVQVIFDPSTIQALVNGMIVTVGVTVVTILICSMAAFVIARRNTRMTRATYSYLLIGLIAPFSFIPAIKLLQFIGLYGTFPGLILIDSAIQIPFITLILVGFIRQIPRELDEAAILDGCGPVQLFFRIIFPLLRPITTTAAILLVTFAWNEFRNVLFLMPDSSTWTMPLTVYNYQGAHTFNYALVCANLVVTILPVLLVYLFSQKNIMSGAVAGAVK